MNGNIVSAAAKALISSNPSMRDKCNFSRHAGTTFTPLVPRGVYEECKLTYLSDIKYCIKQHKIPPELILNADQTPSSYLWVE